MSERCKRTSEKTSEWPSTSVCMFGCSGPQCILILTGALSPVDAVGNDADEIKAGHISSLIIWRHFRIFVSVPFEVTHGNSAVGIRSLVHSPSIL